METLKLPPRWATVYHVADRDGVEVEIEAVLPEEPGEGDPVAIGAKTKKSNNLPCRRFVIEDVRSVTMPTMEISPRRWTGGIGSKETHHVYLVRA